MTHPAGDPVRRAFAAYFKTAEADGGIPIQPANTSGLRSHDGHDYVVLENANGVLAVYRVRNDGVLRRMKRWPVQVEQS